MKMRGINDEQKKNNRISRRKTSDFFSIPFITSIAQIHLKRCGYLFLRFLQNNPLASNFFFSFFRFYLGRCYCCCCYAVVFIWNSQENNR